MESHVLNAYRQPNYRVHSRVGSTSESYSSEGSGVNNSPEYTVQGGGDPKISTVSVNVTDASSDNDDGDDVESRDVIDDVTQQVGGDVVYVDSDEDYEVVVDDGCQQEEVVQVFEVDPNLDLECSDEEYDTEDPNTNHWSIEHNTNHNDNEYYSQNEHNFDIPKEQTVVNDVDEYFVKDSNIIPKGDEECIIEEVEEYLVKPKIPDVNNEEHKVDNAISKTVDPDILPHIENIKKFLLEDIPCPKFNPKSQRSCSLPHSPAHISYLDVDDARTSLSFEDLNLELHDFNFDDSKCKADDPPRTLTDEDVNSFLITPKTEKVAVKDDFSQLDMDIECAVEAKIEVIQPVITAKPVTLAKPVTPAKPVTSAKLITPTKPILQTANVLDFCKEKVIKAEIKTEQDDFVDVESVNDAAIPLLEANNVSSLLEQFEATEKLNSVNIGNQIVGKVNGLNGTRLQDAALQLNKNKMRHILMTPSSAHQTKKPQTVITDHDYCTQKKGDVLPVFKTVKPITKLKGGQSLLKPEVLSSNNKILRSRHRSCKNKKVIYNVSTDEEPDEGAKNKESIKQSVKATLNSNHRKKLSPFHEVSNISIKNKSNNTVIPNKASKASDNDSQTASGSIKLTIKNRSKVILNLNCDVIKNKDEVKNKCISQYSSVPSKEDTEKIDIWTVGEENKINNDITYNISTNIVIKQNNRPYNDFYTEIYKPADVQITLPDPVIVETKNNEEIKPQKKKLNLQEYKLRGTANSNQSSRTVSPETTSPDVVIKSEKTVVNDVVVKKDPIATPQKVDSERKIFDPIREASRKILMVTKKQKAETMRKSEDVVIKSEKTVVNNVVVKKDPIITPQKVDSERKIFEASRKILMVTKKQKAETVRKSEDIVIKSDKTAINDVGVKKDPITTPQKVDSERKIFDPIREASRKILMVTKKHKAEAMRKREEDILMRKIPKVENLELQPLISDAEMQKIFDMQNGTAEKVKIKSEYEEKTVISIGVNTTIKNKAFDRKSASPNKDRQSPTERRLSPSNDKKIDENRFKDIKATLKSVERNVEKKISSNSLFASIQDVVKKAANKDEKSPQKKVDRSPIKSNEAIKAIKTVIVRDYDPKQEHGEDKIILHLVKNREKPSTNTINIQTEPHPDFNELPKIETPKIDSNKIERKCSESSSCGRKKIDSRRISPVKRRTRSRSRSNGRFSRYRRRSRTRSRTRDRSYDRYRRHRRADPPRRRKRTRSPYRKRRSYSRRRSYRARSRSPTPRRSYSPVPKKQKSAEKVIPQEKTERREDASPERSYTPPLVRKPTVSESSDSSTSSNYSSSSQSSSSSCSSSSSSSSTSSSSGSTYRSRGSMTPPRRAVNRNKRAYNSENRDCITPVEERRIVFVGKLEDEATKSSLRAIFTKFGPIVEIRLHKKEDGTRYGFITFSSPGDAWSAVSSAGSIGKYDVGFGGRRAFCQQRYADLDGLEAEYESYPQLPPKEDVSFEDMLQDMMKKINERKKNDEPKA